MLCAAALAACGGGSSKPLTRAQLAVKANAICAETNAFYKKLGPPAGTTPKDYAAYLPKDVGRIKVERSSIKAFKPGSAEKASFDTYVNTEGAIIGTLGKALRQARSGDASTMNTTLQSTAKSGQVLVSSARALGWTECTKLTG